MRIINYIETNKKFYRKEEYIKLEENSLEKHEYHDGKIIKMTGGTTNHNKLAGKIYARLLFTLEDKNYEIYMGDVRLWIEEKRIYTYPDVMVIKGNPIYEGDNKATIVNPFLIVEVLSKSTQIYDQNQKFENYKFIPEFQEYILINQYELNVKQFIKNSSDEWIQKDYFEQDNILKLDSIDFTISLKDLYKGINFSDINT